ncbi:MAG: ATP-binding protein [Bacteroidota bacterium]|nr:ATP-binding protein [Bacteroidota bacterium]
MRYPFRLLLLLLLLTALPARRAAAQVLPDTARTELRTVPLGGTVLDRGWKFREGDDPAWAGADFDDAAWQPINPNQLPSQLPLLRGVRVGWLRLHLQVPDSLHRRTLVLLLQQTGATEVYLNGHLLRRLGRVSAEPDEVEPGSFTAAPLEVHFAPGREQVLAVRFAPWPPLAWFKDNINFLRVRITGLPGLLRRNTERAVAPAAYFATCAVFLLLSLLHLFFRRYNPAQRANLYFALYAATAAVGFLALYAGWQVEGMVASLGLGIASDVFVLLSYVWAVRALYELFGFRPGRVYAGLWAALLGCLLLSEFTQLTSFSVKTTYSFAYFSFVLLVSAEQLRLTLRGMRQRQRGAGLIAAGYMGALLCAGAYALLIIAQVPITFRLSATLLALMGLLPALGISLFLAREFATNSELLLVKLRQVQELSAEAADRQAEKQALLATENERLEIQVAARTLEVAGQRDRAEQALARLRETQQQLVQAEKMAFLGELTAGIAHELQNPLTFMKSFADVSTGLVADMDEAEGPGGELGSEILAGLKQNLQQISQHGQRASSIIKDMLAHSRSGTSPREATDLNALARQYLHLAFEGFKTREPAFEVRLTLALDPNLPPLTVVAADLGRVLLNLGTNALQAVHGYHPPGAAGYAPEVTLTTRAVPGGVEIRVRDNGPGMPAPVRDRVFQPFFTTKPPEEGTGLGLSLSHDIIVKGHGGTLSVESTEGSGTEFRIALPV